MIEARGLGLERQGRRVLDAIDLRVEPGEFVGVLGPNGAGKSSLLRLLAAVERPAQGDVLLDGHSIWSQYPCDRARRLAYLPQSGAVHGPVTVREAVTLGRLPYRGEARPSRGAAVDRAIARLDLSALAERPVTQLSGGERARVLLARMLAVEAKWIVADEPTQALDPHHQLLALELLAEEAAAGRGVVTVLHDWSLAARFCSRIVLLADGRMVVQGTPADVLSDRRLGDVYRVTVRLTEAMGKCVPYAERRLP